MPWGRSLARDMIPYMTSTNQVPIMTNSESVLQLGPNAYGKPSAALHILRDTILGRERFDFAFREYSRRWKFKRPTPADFFRTMEEASGTDLDWFWRGWFYTTDHVDISIDRVFQLRLDTEDPDIDYARARQQEEDKPTPVGVTLNAEQGLEPWVERNPNVTDFYDENDIFTVTNKERNAYQAFLDGLEPDERATFARAIQEDRAYYVLEFSNHGGLVMPIILGLEFADGTMEKMYIPAEIWRRNPHSVRKLLVFDQGTELTQVVLDPDWETGDANVEDNYSPRRFIPSRLEAYRAERSSTYSRRDIMQDIKTELDESEEEASEPESEDPTPASDAPPAEDAVDEDAETDAQADPEEGATDTEDDADVEAEENEAE